MISKELVFLYGRYTVKTESGTWVTKVFHFKKDLLIHGYDKEILSKTLMGVISCHTPVLFVKV